MGYRKLTIDELLKELDKYNHTELHVHHTYIPNHSHFKGNNHVRLQDGMRNFHVNTNGWNDIAQHVTLFPDGTFLTGRNFASQPVSIKGKNGSGGKYPFAVEMIGNFDIGNDTFEGKQKESMLKLAKYFDDKKNYVRFHRENASKTCPGTGIDKGVFMKEAREIGKVKMVSNKPVNDYAGTFAEKEIELLKELKIMVGYADGSFKPNQPLTRGEFAKALGKTIQHLKG